MKRIILTGGGTAGHVTPNIALIPKLRELGFDIHYIGSYNGIEKDLIEPFGIPYHGIATGKLRRYFDLRNFSDPFRVIKGFNEAKKLMKELNFKPQKTGLIVNRVPDGKLDAGTLEEIRNQGLELLGVVPHDDQVYQYDCAGKPIIRLPKDSPVRSALGEIVKKLGL